MKQYYVSITHIYTYTSSPAIIMLVILASTLFLTLCLPSPPPALALSQEEKSGLKASETDHVKLYGMLPPIEKMDATLNTLSHVRHLSLSTNAIEKISTLSGLRTSQLHPVHSLSLSVSLVSICIYLSFSGLSPAKNCELRYGRIQVMFMLVL
eukprot:TRINITY_DN648_c1_g1_i2.p1 TRINITY_DN648_c1_g1~~TRINITY_DN648_c1_g1_i2.p1  ORF type:complete len:153 (-),score=3.63 TRINITY_DN648_c1_g1_i2:60-518(-)